ncbi:hypothetical protein K1I36_06465 [Corynebacterium silvaticum]|nr:hypothetical protein [Corynebacterium silvaticum]NOM64363.1 hypothetical protein [Corynebacterium silvaticum]NON69572.1 hypothetical protein [Corynebacterium silvaticum]TFA94319.1 hypothetical protein EU802_02365 [Corynebacterium silvaticum]TFA97349.1 hypothetical protein EU799_00765 [Corynebacterium silvaticum]
MWQKQRNRCHQRIAFRRPLQPPQFT